MPSESKIPLTPWALPPSLVAVGTRVAVVTVLLAAVVTGSALAAATPVSPPPGATVTSTHPVLTWTLPPDETSSGIAIASRPNTTPEGEFYDENVVDFDPLDDHVRQWAPTRALFAGPYWWKVRSTKHIGPDEIEVVNSTPSPFRVAGYTRIRSIRVRGLSFTYVPSSLYVTVYWNSNVHEKRLTAGIYRNGRLLWRTRQVESDEYSMDGLTTFEWQKPRRIRKGTKLRLVVSVRGGAAVSSLSRVVRAP